MAAPSLSRGGCRRHLTLVLAELALSPVVPLPAEANTPSPRPSLLDSPIPGLPRLRPHLLPMVGMAATLASVCSVPLTSVLLLFELTKDYRILLPLMIGPDHIEALYQYAKFQFECGNYSGAADYLYQYGALCTNSERNNFSSPLNQLQNRIWLMHWALFIFFNHIRYLNAIQTNAHHLIRYLATSVVVNKRRRNMLKELIKVIQQEHHTYKDPITEFLECLYVNYVVVGF
ncbi:Eukaryotic translation initiation factor 3 subunit E [Zea mays]|uniref:Eukaryotic translation initiation factor 3 subunit E n=2 Tax=Zea mays TaxID=4577 RepID=A0A1D6I5B0_MAIZE|nr:Eukaryotic translation initiation factor 3 subunit E [Zea mays]